MNDAPIAVIARCEKCGRGFVTLPKGRMIDSYVRRDTPRADLETAKECGGRLRLLEPTLSGEDHPNDA